MRKIFYLIVFLLTVLIAATVYTNPADLTLTFSDWTISMPFWLASASIFVILTIIFFISKIISLTSHIFAFLKQWLHHRRITKAQSKTTAAFIELAKGKWKKAESHAMQGAKYSGTPLINYLSAAKAANEQGKTERRDQYLQLAYEVAPKKYKDQQLLKLYDLTED